MVAVPAPGSKKRALDFSSLKYMAEQVEGSFAFTVWTTENLYFVKGDNPLCLYHFPRTGVYLYASTEEILKCALTRLRLRLGASRADTAGGRGYPSDQCRRGSHALRLPLCV